MTAPQLTAYRQGLGVASGDGLNTFESTCDTFNDLRAFIGLPGIQVFARGGAAINDGLGGPFYWSANATGPDDGINVIVPTGAALGAWIRLAISPLNIAGTLVYGLPIYIEGKPGAGEEYPIFLPLWDSRLPVGLAVSRFRIGTAPASTLTCTFKKNGSPIGTVAFSPSGVPTVTFLADVDFDHTTDYLAVDFPGSQDSTGANIAMTLAFTVIQA